MQRQVVLHWGEAARAGGEVSNTLVFTVQHLSEMICNKMVSDQFLDHKHNFEINILFLDFVFDFLFGSK